MFEQKTAGISLSTGVNVGKQYLSYGFDYDVSETRRPESRIKIQSDGTDDGGTRYAPFPKAETERFGVYIQDSIEIGERLTLVPGVRYDHYQMTPKADEDYDSGITDPSLRPQKISDSNVSGRLGVIYDITENASLYFQASQGFKVPPYDLAYIYHDNFAAFPYWYRLIPADNLVPEESDSFELGVRGTDGPFSYSIAAYRNNYDNFIQIAYVDTVIETTPYGFDWDLNIFQYQNIEAVKISGLELKFGLDLSDNVHLFVNAEAMDGEDEETNEKLRTIQPVRGTLGLRVDSGPVAFDTAIRWVDGMRKHPEGALTTNGYATVDVYSYFNVTEKLSIRVGLVNLLDKKYIEYSRIAGIPDDGRDLTLYTEPGRTLSARLRYDF
jgi:hemoglobin/transferrin/lactoferrin receptor protein